MFRENKEVNSYTDLIIRLKGISKYITITEGGSWSATNRIQNVDAVAGIVSSCFRDRVHDPGAAKWLTEFESLLVQSKTEQTCYDFKQGFIRLDGSNTFDSDSFNKIIQTLTAIANNSARTTGYVCVGVCDKKKEVDRIKSIYGIDCVKYKSFYISGIGHEATLIAKDLDVFYRLIIQKIYSQPVSKQAKDFISKNIRVVNYFEKDVFIFKIQSLESPMIYDGKYYVRHGANIDEVKPEDYPTFFQSYK